MFKKLKEKYNWLPTKNSVLIEALKRNEFGGLLVDHRGFPPSNKGIVKHLLRKGFLIKSRSFGKSLVSITDLGKEHMKRIKII